jgi:hypothetical protein
METLGASHKSVAPHLPVGAVGSHVVGNGGGILYERQKCPPTVGLTLNKLPFRIFPCQRPPCREWGNHIGSITCRKSARHQERRYRQTTSQVPQSHRTSVAGEVFPLPATNFAVIVAPKEEKAMKGGLEEGLDRNLNRVNSKHMESMPAEGHQTITSKEHRMLSRTIPLCLQRILNFDAPPN